ncbi:PREDICTED: NADH dehydrogenase [ubiquinone] 1 alpha subcomplex subunit 5 [Tinamus guttatus]|nr:PREDICTED: NADH dehydrogenase [ubiquinone] 1 alpha subcomplex subunit 5 [Tinamus guttatus]
MRFACSSRVGPPPRRPSTERVSEQSGRSRGPVRPGPPGPLTVAREERGWAEVAAPCGAGGGGLCRGRCEAGRAPKGSHGTKIEPWCMKPSLVPSLQTTGLVGLAVSENPHERLRILYTKILTVLQSIPKDAAYRKYTEQIVNQRMNLVQTEKDVQKLEDKLNSGHIEEVILQAENELSLARKMTQWKPWEPLVDEPPSDQWRWPI